MVSTPPSAAVRRPAVRWAGWARPLPGHQTGRGQIPRGTPPIPCGQIRVARCVAQNDWLVLFFQISIPIKSLEIGCNF
jgi:hypothetical protein